MIYSVVDDRSGACYQEYRNAYGEDVALLAQLMVTYEDGRTMTAVATDGAWRASTGPIWFWPPVAPMPICWRAAMAMFPD